MTGPEGILDAMSAATTDDRPILIARGRVFDGSPAPARERHDVLVRGGKVDAIAPTGTLTVPDAHVIDATDRWVTPGFIDTHTHYDAELAVQPGLWESVRHGVTSVLVGSCSVSFVASDPEDCSDMFTRVEAVPRDMVLPMLRETKAWDTPAGWRDWVDGHPIGPNVGSFLGHSDIRCRAMGLARSVTPGERPSSDEQRQMEQTLEAALDCGFLGLSGMTNPWDKLDGDRQWSQSLPSYYAKRGERRRLEAILRRRGAILQTAPNLVTRVNIIGMALASGGRLRKPLRTTVITMMDLKADGYVFKLTSAVAWLANVLLGGDFRWQSPPVPFDLFYDGMESVLFEEFPTGEAIRDLARDRDARAKLLADPAYRKAFRRELHKRLAPKVWHRDLDDARILDCPDLALVGKTFAEVAVERGEDAIDTFLDLMIEHDNALRWHTCVANQRPEVLHAIQQHPGTLMSFADSGAHLRNMAFYNFPVRMLRQVWQAEQAGRGYMSVERAVHRLTGELAAWFGLDAGRLVEGARADVTVVDPARLDESVDAMHLAPFGPAIDCTRLVCGGEAVRDVLIGGVPVVEGGARAAALGERRTGVFLDARR